MKKETKIQRAKRLRGNTARYRARRRDIGLVPITVDVFEIDRPALRAAADALIEARLQKNETEHVGIPTNGDDDK